MNYAKSYIDMADVLTGKEMLTDTIEE